MRSGTETHRGATGRAIVLRPRATAALTLVSVASLVAFVWPLFISASGVDGQSADAPWLFAALLPVLVGILLAEMSEGGIDAKALAILAVLAAVGAALRPLGAGTAGVETVFFLLILAARIFGPGFGFMLGAITLFGSALLTGGVGPWLPYQMMAAGWVGLGAAWLPAWRGRAELVLLVAYGIVSSYLFGALMNLSFWPFTLGTRTDLSFVPGGPVAENLRRFLVYHLVTSMGWDTGRAITNSLLLVTFGQAVLVTLRRVGRRAAFAAPVEFRALDTARGGIRES